MRFNPKTFKKTTSWITEENIQEIISHSVTKDNISYDIDDKIVEELFLKFKNNLLPSRTEMVKNLISSLEQISREDLNLRSKEDIEKIFNICFPCRFFKDEGPRCSICGCFLKLKVRIESSHCPLKKW